MNLAIRDISIRMIKRHKWYSKECERDTTLSSGPCSMIIVLYHWYNIYHCRRYKIMYLRKTSIYSFQYFQGRSAIVHKIEQFCVSSNSYGPWYHTKNNSCQLEEPHLHFVFVFVVMYPVPCHLGLGYKKKSAVLTGIPCLRCFPFVVCLTSDPSHITSSALCH